MESPESISTEPEPTVTFRPRWTRARCFRWGVVLWIGVWILSVCFYWNIQIQVRGIPSLIIGMEQGAICLHASDAASTVTRFDLDRSFAWDSSPSLEKRHIGGIAAILANAGWRLSSDGSTIWFPSGGLLWLWLAGAWVAEVFRRRRIADSPQARDTGPPKFDGFLHPSVLALLTIALGGTLCLLVARSHAASNVRVCAIHVDSLQSCVRAWHGMQGLLVGQPLDWKEIAGPSKFVSTDYLKCPSGDDYELLPVVPDLGQLAARCPHPEHRQYFYTRPTMTGETWQPEPAPPK